jgi:Dyp-type peroxidase family
LRGTSEEFNELRSALPSAHAEVLALASNRRATEFGNPSFKPIEDIRMVRERIRNGLQGLAALYRLVDLHRPATPDGDVLRRAAVDLLYEFVQMRDNHLITDQLTEEKVRFARQLAWLFPADESEPVLVPRQCTPAGAETAVLPVAALRDIQGGIVKTYDKLTHGALLMLAFDSASTADGFFAWLDKRLTRANDSHEAKPGMRFYNLGLTLAGLRASGLDEDSLELFPEEFRQGMAARAGLLGDVRNNHPRRWRLPRRRVDGSFESGAETIELDTVHAVLQLRCGVADDDKASLAATELHHEHHPLRADVQRVLAENPGLRLLAVQPLRRYYNLDDKSGEKRIVEHFGYQDGDGQPELRIDKEAPPSRPFDYNRIHPGELILGYENAADGPVDPLDPDTPEPIKARARWLGNGSFLVMRKYRQFVDEFEAAIEAAAKDMVETLGDTTTDFKELVRSKLMGRTRDGMPLVPGPSGSRNNFLYRSDPEGKACPLHAHIRRAHPRAPKGTGARPPRLMRRSMSFGPERGAPVASDGGDRGLVFMAYNASISEQFEVVQSWLTGGNSSGAASGESCPIVGVPENGVPRYFRFEHKEHVFRVKLEQTDPRLFDEPQVLTRLEWGLYLFAPSVSVLRRLRSVAATAASAAPACPVPWRLERGREMIATLQAIETSRGEDAALQAWKAAIEDPESIDRLDCASLWAVIRKDHGGVLKTPYGTLVANRELVAHVFLDPHRRYSVCGQFERMKRSFGEISLGLDDGPDYREQSRPINDAIDKLSTQETFELAFLSAKAKIDAIVEESNLHSVQSKDTRVEVGFDVREVVDVVLATLCEAWFGLSDDPGKRFDRGSADWAWQPGQKPLYPGHFTAMSRYMFQPHPGQTVVELGERYGQALREAMRLFVADHRAAGTTPQFPAPPEPGVVQVDAPIHVQVDAPIALAAFNHPLFGADDDFVARNMVGVLMGFNPTIIGAVLNVVREWGRDDRFSALRAALAEEIDFSAIHSRVSLRPVSPYLRAEQLGRCFAEAQALLLEPMAAAARMRPMPQIGWRTAREAHRLGLDAEHGVDIAAGDKLVLGMVSGTQQSLADGRPDCHLMFGGERLKDAPHPTHACPGYKAAIGAMLGTLTALLARPEQMRPGAAPLTFLLERETVFPPPQPAANVPAAQAAATSPSVKRPKARARREREPGSLGLVLGWGDSWLDYQVPLIGKLGNDLRDCLEILGYEAPPDYCKWTTWPKARTMADAPEKFCAFLREQLQTNSRPLRAVLLSAGGNDSTQDTLKEMLLDNPGGKPEDAFDPVLLNRHIQGLRASYDTMVKAIANELATSGMQSVPMLVHGYDHPHAEGRSGIKRWLYDPFSSRKYELDSQPGDKAAADAAMHFLIDQLNEMLEGLQRDFPDSVRYVNLRGIILDGHKNNNAVDWANDLHPTSEAFALMAAKMHRAIQSATRATKSVPANA